MKKLMVLQTVLWMSLSALGAVTVHNFDNPQQEAQYQALINDFRCPTCQNQNLAGSDAPIAQDLKQKTYEMIKDGRTDGEIRAYMFERYGDFISYKPPVRPSTWILWFFPPILLVVVILGWILKSRSTKKVTTDTLVPLSAKEEELLDTLLDAHKSINSHKKKDALGNTFCINNSVDKDNVL